MGWFSSGTDGSVSGMLRSIRDTGGFTPSQRNEMDLFFYFAKETGASKERLQKGVDWLRKNTSLHSLSTDKIDLVEQRLGLASKSQDTSGDIYKGVANDNHAPNANSKAA